MQSVVPPLLHEESTAEYHQTAFVHLFRPDPKSPHESVIHPPIWIHCRTNPRRIVLRQSPLHDTPLIAPTHLLPSESLHTLPVPPLYHATQYNLSHNEYPLHSSPPALCNRSTCIVLLYEAIPLFSVQTCIR